MGHAAPRDTPDDARGASGTVTAARVAEFERVLARVERWSARRPDVVAVGLAGSWAAATPRMDSDADLVVITTTPDAYLTTAGWAADLLPGARPVRTGRWGPLLEQRLALPGGFEIELGFAGPGWAATDPVAPGTARVVTDGFQIRYDPDALLARLVTALRRA